MKEVYLKVTKSLPDDFGRGIARIDPPAFPELRLSQGDVIEIAGKRTTVAMVMGSGSDGGDTERIRIDGFTRQNADVDIGEQVKVRKAQVREATYISFAPLEGTAIQFNDNIVEKIKTQLKNRPIIRGDAVPLMSGSNPFLSSEQPNLAITFVAVRVEPSGPVVITDNTEIDIRYKPAKLSEGDASEEAYMGLREEAKRLRDIIDLQLKQPQLFEQVGISPFKGILLHGAPGAGNKLLAEAVISGSNYPVFNVDGLDLLSKYYGQSEEKLKEIVEDAEEHAPSIILVENLEVLAPRNKSGMSDEERKLLARFISLLDYMEDRVVVIALVNNVSDIDQSLRTNGRFEMEIEMQVPDEKDRLEILQMYTRDMPLDNVDLENLAKLTEGFLDSDLQSIVKKAALNALFRSVPMSDIGKPLPENVKSKIRVKMDDFNAVLEELYQKYMSRGGMDDESQKRTGGFDVDKQRFIDSITDINR